MVALVFKSLLKKILQNKIVSLVDIAYPQGFVKDKEKKRTFFVKLLGKTLSGFTLTSTSQVLHFIFQVPPRYHITFENHTSFLKTPTQC